MHEQHCAPLIRQIHCAIEKDINNSLRASDLTHAQICLIFTLIERCNGSSSLKQLEKLLGLAQSTTVGLVKRTEEKNLVECFSDSEDRRIKSVRITEKGTELYWKTKDHIQQSEDLLLKDLNAEERTLFYDLLNRVYNGLSSR